MHGPYVDSGGILSVFCSDSGAFRPPWVGVCVRDVVVHEPRPGRREVFGPTAYQPTRPIGCRAAYPCAAATSTDTSRPPSAVRPCASSG